MEQSYKVDTIVHRDGNDLWYFWNETQDHEFGPFPTQEKAIDALQEYCQLVLGRE